jgi:hypothetical protein
MWQKEIISQALILEDLLMDLDETTLDPPFLSKIRHEVWTHFEKNPPEAARDVGSVRTIVIDEFEKVVSSCLDLPKAIKEVFLESLKNPSHTHEDSSRRIVGLGPLQED